MISYADACVPIRPDLPAAHAERLAALARPGTWWSGAERIAIATEVRNAAHCPLCREREAALSPNAVEGKHADLGALPEAAVEAVHRVTRDPGRLSKSWFDSVLARGLGVEAYVELIGVVVSVVSMDAFCWAMGLPQNPLPDPEPGEPTRSRPAHLVDGGAWVPMLDPKRVAESEADLFPNRRAPNVLRALSSVPDEVRALRALSKAHYFEVRDLLDFSRGMAIDRMQVELVAARVSALNECFY